MAEDLLRAFDTIVARADAPVWIVTAVAGDQRAGCLVGFAAQVSIEPRRFLVGLSTNNYTFTVAAAATHLAVHLLDQDGLPLAQLFGSETGTDLDKFEHCDWHPGAHGLPILHGAAAWFTGEVVQRTDFGDHVGFVLAPTAAGAPTDLSHPLRFDGVADLEPGQPAG
ncbi:flavin reductase family protein [Nocardia huaxiensis]|uniref:Flavin reductase n=1 Tax=Nocardia huaxiensis TaxID=2755382 RepID=A0A7D6VBF7_9NOCA|nr:flavin reductase family protein [Nocardia huaxiensis]QLY28195.1 flavin reductase [Nocardia huaxiensis]UFS98370.1 flavin reductase family protein [Nocardia huaxiensis]